MLDKTFTTRQIEQAALVLVVDPDGRYTWASTRTDDEVAHALRHVAHDADELGRSVGIVGKYRPRCQYRCPAAPLPGAPYCEEHIDCEWPDGAPDDGS